MNQSYVQLWSLRRHQYPGEWVAIGRAVVYYTWATCTFSARIKCRHCTTHKSIRVCHMLYLILMPQDPCLIFILLHWWLYVHHLVGGFRFMTSLSNSIMALYSCLTYPLCYRWYIVHIPHVYHLIISSVKLIDSSKLMLSAIPFTLYSWLQIHFWYWQPHWWL